MIYSIDQLSILSSIFFLNKRQILTLPNFLRFLCIASDMRFDQFLLFEERLHYFALGEK
jgi:hypothetical protein